MGDGTGARVWECQRFALVPGLREGAGALPVAQALRQCSWERLPSQTRGCFGSAHRTTGVRAPAPQIAGACLSCHERNQEWVLCACVRGMSAEEHVKECGRAELPRRARKHGRASLASARVRHAVHPCAPVQSVLPCPGARSPGLNVCLVKILKGGQHLQPSISG